MLTYCIPYHYNHNFTDDSALVKAESKAAAFPYPLMYFYGVGNHGGGPTITNIEIIHAYQEKNAGKAILSHPNAYFNELRTNYFDKLPAYVGELQNHASGCYSANSRIKLLNRTAENRLGEAERMEVLSAACAGQPLDAAADAVAWQKVLFNQFHDILCGCSVKSSYEDAYAFEGTAISHGLELTNAAVQRISWDIDTYKDSAVHSKEYKGAMWESNNLGTPIVVFNPLSYPVKIPVKVHLHTCAAVTDDNDQPIAHQMVRADYTNRALDRRSASFLAQVPAYGWRTYWVYRERVFAREQTTFMQIEPHRIANDKMAVTFNPITGEISSIRTDGKELLGKLGCRAIVLDDSPYDTWAHAQFVFESEIGEFGQPSFKIIDQGECQVSLRVTQSFRTSTLERTYTLYPGDDTLHVSTRLVLNEKSVMVKFTFDAGLPEGEFIREVPGDIITTYPSGLRYEDAGRELPMLRFMAIREHKGECGLAVLNNGKYSSSCRNGELRMVAARSCYYGDHFGQRDGSELPQDIGEQEFLYAIRPCSSDLGPVVRAAEILNTAFPVIAETYHKGSLPQTASHASLTAENVIITCIKPAENGHGIIVRLTEVAGQQTKCSVRILDTDFEAELAPFAIQSYRLTDGLAERCNFLEEACSIQLASELI